MAILAILHAMKSVGYGHQNHSFKVFRQIRSESAIDPINTLVYIQARHRQFLQAFSDSRYSAPASIPITFQRPIKPTSSSTP
jgi:hypothetical protein